MSLSQLAAYLNSNGNNAANRSAALAQWGATALSQFDKKSQSAPSEVPREWMNSNPMLRNQDPNSKFVKDAWKNAWLNDDGGLESLYGGASASGGSAANPGGAAQEKITRAVQPGVGGTTAIGAGVQYDKEGRPIRNDYQSILDGAGNLNKQFSLADKIGPDVAVDQRGMDAIRERALATGPSAWANLAMEKQGLEQNNAMNSANRSAAQATTGAFNNLRARGGLSAGQRERLAMQGARGASSAQQGVMNQGLLNRSNILLQDQQSKDQFLQQLPGMDMNMANFNQGQRAFNANAQQFDLGNKLRDVGGFNAFNADAYGKAMQEWSAGKTADAQAAASSGGGKK